MNLSSCAPCFCTALRAAADFAVCNRVNAALSSLNVRRNCGRRRTSAAASKPEAILMSVGSLHADAMKVMPTGRSNV